MKRTICLTLFIILLNTGLFAATNILVRGQPLDNGGPMRCFSE